MKFLSYIQIHRVPEWYHYYINYSALHDLLQALQDLFDRKQELGGKSSHMVLTTESDDQQIVAQVDLMFMQTIEDQIALFSDFMHYKFDIRLKKRLVILDYNMRRFSTASMTPEEKARDREMLKIALFKYCKEVNLFKRYIALNEKIFKKLTNYYMRIMKGIGVYDIEKGKKLNDLYLNSNVETTSNQVDLLQKLVENTILSNYFKGRRIQKGHEEIKKLEDGSQFTKPEAWQLGIYVGVLIMCVIVAIVLMAESSFFSEEQGDFIIYQFPIFRGTFVLFIYFLSLGVNVYTWEHSNLNYKKVFNIQLVNTNPFEIMMAGFGFLTIWTLLFLYCGISNLDSIKKGAFFSATVSQYLPPTLWVFFLVFLFFPTRKWLFGQARWFLLTTIKNVLIGPFTDFSPLTNFALDQMPSFVTTFKDFAYSFCYFVNLMSSGSMKNTCDKYPFKTAFLVVIVFPGVLKMCFLINRLVFLLIRRPSNLNFKNDLTRLIINICRISIGLVTSFASFFSGTSNGMFIAWIVLSIISALYMYFWDIVIEWGFLSNKYLLRDPRVFQNTWVYYVAMVTNLGLRYAWTITISPSLFTSNVTKSVITTTTAVLEVFRRTVWNIFKVELDHLRLVGTFKSMNDDALPFPIDFNMQDRAINHLVKYQFKKYLESVHKNKHLETVDMNMNKLNDKIMEILSQGNTLQSKLSFVSKITKVEYYFINEKDEANGLQMYKRSLEQCKAFTRGIRAKIQGPSFKEFLLCRKYAKKKQVRFLKKNDEELRLYVAYEVKDEMSYIEEEDEFGSRISAESNRF
jgi:hypothetical protein